MLEWIIEPNKNGEYININIETGRINYARRLEWCPYINTGHTTVGYIKDNINKIDDWLLQPFIKWCKKRKVEF